VSRQFGTPVCFFFSIVTLFSSLAYSTFFQVFSTSSLTFPCLFACAGGFEMDQDSSPKVMALLHELHLKNPSKLKWQRQQRQQQQQQPRRRKWRRPPATASANTPRYTTYTNSLV
jgi:hypothetical protein